MFLLKNTLELNSCPPQIKGKVFRRFLEVTKIEQLTPKEMEAYTKSLKQNYYLRDMAKCERLEGRMEKSREFAVRLLQRETPIDDVISLTDLTKEQVEELLI